MATSRLWVIESRYNNEWNIFWVNDGTTKKKALDKARYLNWAFRNVPLPYRVEEYIRKKK